MLARGSEPLPTSPSPVRDALLDYAKLWPGSQQRLELAHDKVPDRESFLVFTALLFLYANLNDAPPPPAHAHAPKAVAPSIHSSSKPLHAPLKAAMRIDKGPDSAEVSVEFMALDALSTLSLSLKVPSPLRLISGQLEHSWEGLSEGEVKQVTLRLSAPESGSEVVRGLLRSTDAHGEDRVLPLAARLGPEPPPPKPARSA